MRPLPPLPPPIIPKQQQPSQSEPVTAPLWRRLFALIYDTFLLFGLLMGYGFACVLGVHALGVDAPHELFRQGGLASWLLFLGMLSLIVGFYSFFWLRNGQTLGMQSWRLQLETTDGAPLSFKHCLIRMAAGVLSWAALGLGFLWCLLPNQGTWHDKLSNTRVTVHEKRK